MKRNRRILSLLLAICLIAALIPAVVTAEVSSVEKAQDDQIVVFGSGNPEGEPLEWIVLENNIYEMVLLLKEPFAPMAYNASGLSNDWEQSDAKAWCDSEDVKDLFTAAEWTALSEEKLFFLSHDEFVHYWEGNTRASLLTSNGWWLRCNDEVDVGGDLFGLAVSDAGFIGTPHVATNYGVRPAIKIPATNISLLEVLDDGRIELKIANANAFSDSRVDKIEVDSKFTKATVTYTGALEGNTVHVVLADRQGNAIKEISKSVTGNGTVELSFDGIEFSGWYSVRAFLADGNVTSPVVRYEFFNSDDHGNVTEWNVNLGGDISANFNIELSEQAKNDDDAKITVSYNGVSKDVPVSSLDIGETTGGNDCVKLPIDMKAPQMNDVISIEISSNGESGGIQQFTIREYAEAVIRSDAPDVAKELMKQMLNYGAKTQVYFNYNSKDLANKNVGFVEQDPVPNDRISAPVINTVTGISLYGASLIMNSNNTLRFYFVVDENSDISTFTFTCNGSSLKATPRKVNGRQMYSVDVIDIAPDKLGDDFVVYVNNSKFVTYSPMAYIQRIHHNVNSDVSAKNLMQALYNYHSAAVAYVENLK